MTGAQYLLDFLRQKGVETSFGYPGGAVIPLYDAMMIDDFPHILARHEQGAIHAAEGYARVSGKPGVVIATSGPGATNLVTGLANAFLDSTPVFAITGQVVAGSIGRDAFQEADTTGITNPVTKHNYLVSQPEQLPYALENAWQIMLEGRSGPVLVDITKNVFLSEIPEEKVERNPKRPNYDNAAMAAKEAAELLGQSERPVILAGGGVCTSPEASAFLHAFSKEANIPVVTTLMGKGAVPESEAYALGMCGMHGLPAANLAVRNCDALLAIGTRFSDRVFGKPEEYGKGRKVLHIDIDEAELGKNVPLQKGYVLESAPFLRELVKEKGALGGLFAPWKAQVAAWKEKYPMEIGESQYILPEEVVVLSRKYAGPDGIAVTDVGQNQMFAAQYYNMERPQSFVTSGGLGTMGFGLPAAIGAAVGAPERVVSLFAGDGGIQMTIQELATLKRLGCNVKVFVLDNKCLGMVRQWQQLFNGERYSHTILNDNPDFMLLAKAYGIAAFEATQKDSLEEAVKAAYSFQGPAVIHCGVDSLENVMPMIPPGKNPEDMMDRKGNPYQE